jgi:hypothetical protein
MTELEQVLTRLQFLLGLDIREGQLTLNFHQDRLQSFETRTYQRMEKQTAIDVPAKQPIHWRANS